jgi:hypothetical protein
VATPTTVATSAAIAMAPINATMAGGVVVAVPVVIRCPISAIRINITTWTLAPTPPGPGSMGHHHRHARDGENHHHPSY